MKLTDFLSLDPEHTISAEDSQNLNATLAITNIKDIPHEHYRMVSDYIVCALSVNSVKPAILPSIEKLLSDIYAATK